MSAYSRALALESIPDCIKDKWNQHSETYSSITDEDLERFAKIVAYKVAYNLRNGHQMNFDIDPLNYMGSDPKYPKNPCIRTIKFV